MTEQEIENEGRKLYMAFGSAMSGSIEKLDPVSRAFLRKLWFRVELNIEEANQKHDLLKDDDLVPEAFFWNMALAAGAFLNETGRWSVLLNERREDGREN